MLTLNVRVKLISVEKEVRSNSMQKDRFHYSLLMEAIEHEFFGVKNSSAGMASAFSNPSYMKKRCKAFLTKIKRRIENTVTNDETLRLLLLNDIDRLDKEFSKVSPKNNNDQEIIAYFFRFVAHLLGWAHMDGKFYRTLVFHQTEEQREADLSKSYDPNLKVGFYEVYKRRQLVKQLLDEGNSCAVVARIMGLTASNVKQLESAEHIDEFYKEMLARTQKD